MTRAAAALAFTLSVAVAVGAQQVADRSTPPVPGPAPTLRLPDVQQTRLSNGISVHLVEMHEVPVVEVALMLRAGASQDPADRFGLASLTAAMLDEGAGTRSALEIADAAAMLGASIATGTSYDASFVQLGVPVARTEPALALMADVALHPTFPAAELERLRTERLTGMLQALDNPAAVASLAFPRLLYGPSHRYGSPEIGTPEAVKRMTEGDLRAFYEAQYRPERAVLIVAGDVKRDEIVPQLEQAFGRWRVPSPAPELRAVPAAAQATARRVVLVDKPGAPQSEVRIGGVGVPRLTPDYFPIIVLNTVLGGSFTSRLNTTLRETHGYAYSAGSQFAMRRAAGPFSAGAGVQTDKTAEAVREFFNEFTAIRTPIPPDEFAKAQRNVALGLPGEFETTEDMVARLLSKIIYELPDDVYRSYVQNVMAVTPEEAARAAQTYIVPSHFLVVVVGDRAQVEAPLRGLNLGPLTVTSVEDALR